MKRRLLRINRFWDALPRPARKAVPGGTTAPPAVHRTEGATPEAGAASKTEGDRSKGGRFRPGLGLKALRKRAGVPASPTDLCCYWMPHFEVRVGDRWVDVREAQRRWLVPFTDEKITVRACPLRHRITS